MFQAVVCCCKLIYANATYFPGNHVFYRIGFGKREERDVSINRTEIHSKDKGNNYLNITPANLYLNSGKNISLNKIRVIFANNRSGLFSNQFTGFPTPIFRIVFFDQWDGPTV